MEVTLKKWGNSVGVIIPSSYLKSLNLKDGSKVTITQDESFIKLEPVKRDRKQELKELVAQITDDNMHTCEDFGDFVGGEIW